ncbi:MAG: flagellar biosynthesis protein FlgC, partial [Deltaproteobacteria bacterium]|nr:flagellar biosynthesis protein FlgC [Deltaproteobacteria bacterium]
MVQGISPPLSALSVLAKKMRVTANNVANALTPGFKKSRVNLADA